MESISQDTLARAKPDYPDYATRLASYIDLIGLENPAPDKPYGEALRRWNRESAIGFSEQELQVLELIYRVDEANARFDNDTHIKPGDGGNTAEHPIFTGLAFDSFRDKAGFTPDAFDPDAPETLHLANIARKTHAMIAVHDVGEIVDISYGEQLKTGASTKEPEEEALVGPFKFKLAAYALSTGQPELYENTIRDMKEDALKAKQKLFQQAMDGKITGDEFVAGVGKVIGAGVAAAEAQMGGQDTAPEYAEAARTLSDLFLEGERGNSLEAHLLHLSDKFEGSFHYSAFAGRPGQQPLDAIASRSPERRMLHRLFDPARSVSYNLAKSATIEGQMLYPQKTVVEAFRAVEELPEETRTIGDRLVAAAGASILRNTATLLQKAPPFIDFSDNKRNELDIEADPDRGRQSSMFATRLDTQRRLMGEAMDGMREKDRVVTGIEGVMDTKAVIAVHDKAASLLESGAWRPDTTTAKVVIPVGEPLPEALHVTRQDIREAVQKYPLDVAKDYRDEGVKLRINSGEATGHGR